MMDWLVLYGPVMSTIVVKSGCYTIVILTIVVKINTRILRFFLFISFCTIIIVETARLEILYCQWVYVNLTLQQTTGNNYRLWSGTKSKCCVTIYWNEWETLMFTSFPFVSIPQWWFSVAAGIRMYKIISM